MFSIGDWRAFLRSNRKFLPTAGVVLSGAAFVLDRLDPVRIFFNWVAPAPWVDSVPGWLLGALIFLLFFSVVVGYRGYILAEELEPKLNCLFHMNEPGCIDRDVLFTGQPAPKMDFYRIKVQGRGFIQAFGGRVTFIKGRRSGEVLNGQNLDLTPAFSGSSPTRDIRDGTTEYLDVLLISQNNKIRFGTQGFDYPNSCAARLLGIENTPDTYEIWITITALSSPSIYVKLQLEWQGNWRTAVMTDITNGRKPLTAS